MWASKNNDFQGQMDYHIFLEKNGGYWVYYPLNSFAELNSRIGGASSIDLISRRKLAECSHNVAIHTEVTTSWDKQLYSPFKCYLPRRIAYSTTYLVLFFKLLLLQLCHLIKFNLHCLQKLEGCCLPLALPFFFCLKMNKLLAKFKGLKSLHLLGKGKTFKKGHLGIKRGLIRKKEGTRYYVQ